MLLALLTAAVLRLWQAGQVPPGLYRDEAFNGLDALTVLQRTYPLFFAANNGREPAYIYLVAAAITLFGRSVLAVRLPAAVVSTLTTWITYHLAASWFGRRVGLLAAWVWAITLWPVHLGRIGFRAVLLAPMLGLLFWLGTTAYRRQDNRFWLAAGLVYGAAFYTYLAVRFTPLLLAAFAIYLLWSRPATWPRWWPGILWFILGTAVTLAPLAFLAAQQPELVVGRSSQVSILNAAVNGGDFWGTLWRHTGRALGMFLWHGDTILRHNPAGRPVFDLFMALPFLLGVTWCLSQWRQPAAAAVLLWTTIMLGPTILAEDTPHFLRATGLLPVLMVLPAIGLNQLWQWSRLKPWVRQAAVITLVAGSLLVTVRDYAAYSRSPDVAYLFEAAARDMAVQINAEPPDTAVFVDERFWSGWPSLRYLTVTPPLRFQPEIGLPAALTPPAAIYAWPYGPLDFIPQAILPPALVTAETGSLSRGDLEPAPYPLYVRYTLTQRPDWPTQANFDNQLWLYQATLTPLNANQLLVDVYWGTVSAVTADLVAFVHVLGPSGLIGQDDAPPAASHWPRAWWQPGLIVRDRHFITLSEPYEADHHQVYVGLYGAETGARLPLRSQTGEVIGDTWQLKPPPPHR